VILCPNPACSRQLSDRIRICPDCGAELSRPERVGEYQLLECVAESRTASIFRARRDGETVDVCLRLYNAEVALSPEEAARLRMQFNALRELPEERFIHTLDFGQAADGLWYRVTPWLPNVMAWGDLKSRELYGDAAGKRRWLDLCLDLAETFRELHQRGRIIPDMTLDDCLLYRSPEGALRVRIDATLASCLGPGSGREKAREAHPDYAPGRTLSEQSDVWTLGSILASMVLGTTGITNYAAALDALNFKRRPVALHPKLGRLLRQMVDADPAERPRDMASVCEALRAFGPADIAEWRALERDPWRHSRLARRIGLGVAAAALAVGVLSYTLHQRQQRHLTDEVAGLRAEDPEQRARAVLARYSRSVAFVLAECWIEVDGVRKTFTTDKSAALTSGSAFLVSSDGYLLTNRHVLFPWASVAGELDARIAELRGKGTPFRLGVNYWLWFDGDPAFRPKSTSSGTDIPSIEDVYRLDTAYASAGTERQVRVAGVMPLPADPAELLNSTLNDDVAVLKINVVPEGATPIPLRAAPLPERGAGVLALGYSHGRASISDTRALVRASRGTVTRLSFDAFSTDADIHPGNSGGPLLDLDGNAIGIVSALFSQSGRTEPGMGWSLPMAVARNFLETVRAGKPAWNGLLMAAFEPEISAAQKAADEGKWQQARKLASVAGVLANPDAALRAAVFCMDRQGFTPEGRSALENAVAMSPSEPFPALLRYWDAWRRNVPKNQRPGRERFIAAEWHSPFEPYVQIVRLLEGDLPFDQALDEAESPIEHSLLLWAAGTLAARDGKKNEAVDLLRRGFQSVDPEDQVLRNLLAASLWFEGGQRPPIVSPAEAKEFKSQPKFEYLKKTFDALASGDWAQASAAVDNYFKTPRRESANSLGMGLLRCQLLGMTGNLAGERAALETFRSSIRNPWYASIAECLGGQRDADELLRFVAGRRPETITLAVALGLRSEREKDTPRAVQCYTLALDTSQTNWTEFQLAQARRQALRKKP